MSIIYLFSLLACSISFLYLKKSNNKLNLITWITITIIATMCYNIVVVLALSSVNIKSTLTALSIVNLIVLLLISFKSYKNREIQKFYVNKKDIFFTILIFGIVVIITIINFKPALLLKYKSVDSASHYTAAREFYRNSISLNKVERTTIFEYNTHMPATYINIGILFKVFSRFVGELNLHKIYILFDMFMLFTIGLAFYSLISDKIKDKKMFIVSSILVILFMIGYPLNSIIYGFSYLTFNLIIITILLKVIPYFASDEINRNHLNIITFLFTFAIFFSYYLFAPAIYASIFIYFIVVFKKQGKVINLQNIKTVLITLVIPTICGFIYFVLPGIIDSKESNLGSIISEGTMYRDAYSNFLFFIPFILYYIIEKIRKKELTFELIFFTVFICFMLALFVGGMLGKVSSYYYFKNYYVLWIISLYIFFNAYQLLSKEKNSRIFSEICLIIYCVTIIGSVFLIERRIANKSNLFMEQEKLSSITDIYYSNIRECINLDEQIFNDKRFELVKQISYLEEKDNIKIDAELMEKFFIYAILDVYGGEKTQDSFDWFYNTELYSTEEWLKTNKKYYLIFFYDYSVTDIEEKTEEYTILYKNEMGALLERV